MGNSQSSDIDENNQDYSLINGFHVLKVKPNSPAEKAGLNPYFDFILKVNDQTTINTLQDFAIYISRFVNQEVKLLVFSLKTRSTRDVILYPHHGWSSNPKDGLLGCSVRYTSVENGLECVWHILEVTPRSPADRAGLQAFSDYIVGCEYRSLNSEDDFYNLVEEHEGKLLSLIVYNKVWDNCREVIILPKKDWGGEGLLGCGVASGLLHRVPQSQATDINDSKFINSNNFMGENISKDKENIGSLPSADSSTPSTMALDSNFLNQDLETANKSPKNELKAALISPHYETNSPIIDQKNTLNDGQFDSSHTKSNEIQDVTLGIDELNLGKNNDINSEVVEKVHDSALAFNSHEEAASSINNNAIN